MSKTKTAISRHITGEGEPLTQEELHELLVNRHDENSKKYTLGEVKLLMSQWRKENIR